MLLPSPPSSLLRDCEEYYVPTQTSPPRPSSLREFEEDNVPTQTYPQRPEPEQTEYPAILRVVSTTTSFLEDEHDATVQQAAEILHDIRSRAETDLNKAVTKEQVLPVLSQMVMDIMRSSQEQLKQESLSNFTFSLFELSESRCQLDSPSDNYNCGFRETSEKPGFHEGIKQIERFELLNENYMKPMDQIPLMGAL